MATHFSANQYENAFAANRLQNYEVPNDFKKHPTAKSGCTKVISNNRGHLLSDVPKSQESPWGNFKGTWDDDLALGKNRIKKTPVPQSSRQREVTPPVTPSSPEQDSKVITKEVAFA